jgi:hypothetical protein
LETLACTNGQRGNRDRQIKDDRKEGFAAKVQSITPLLCLGLKTLRLHQMSLAMEREDMPDNINDIIEALELFLCSRKTHGLPLQELQATEVDLYGEPNEEVENWQTHFLQWVDKVELDKAEHDEDESDED